MKITTIRLLASSLLFLNAGILATALAALAAQQLAGHGFNILWNLTVFYFWTGPFIWGAISSLVPFVGKSLSRKTFLTLDIVVFGLMLILPHGSVSDVVMAFREMPIQTTLIICGIVINQLINIGGSCVCDRLNKLNS